MATRRVGIRAVLTVVLALAAAGCGGQSGSGPAAPPGPSGSPTTSTSVVARPSSACSSGSAQHAIRLTTTIDGVKRSALVHVPSSATGTVPLPVVISFHGGYMDAAAQRSVDGLVKLGNDKQFVVVHPQGLVVDVDDQVQDVMGWDVKGKAVDEPKFVGALIDELGTKTCIDLARVFATGLSNGGAMAMLLACELPGKIAAVAPVEAAYYTGMPCRSPHAVPVLAFHGDQDLVVPVGGSTAPRQAFRPVLDVVQEQATRNGCTGAPTDTTVNGIRTRSWQGCAAATELVTLANHGHAWPGHPYPATQADIAANTQQEPWMTSAGLTPDSLAANMLLTSMTLDATTQMWDFFTSATT